MPQPTRHAAFKAYVLLVCAAWVGVLTAAIAGLLASWWIPAGLAVAVALIAAGVAVEVQLDRRAEKRELVRLLVEAKRNPARWLRPVKDREAHRAAIAAEEEAWLGSPEQPR